MDGMTMVARTTDDSDTVMKFDLGDSDSPLYCPDGVTQVYNLRVLTTSISGTYEGCLVHDALILAMRIDPDFNGFIEGTEEDAVFSRGDVNFTSGCDLWVELDSTNKCVEVVVKGLASHTINWVAHISRGVQGESNYYSAASGG